MRNRHPAHPVRKSVSIQRLNRAAFEVLEDRRLLAATITGVKFDDVNADGQYDVGIDRPLADQLIYVDLNNNGQFDAGTSTHASVLQPPASIPDEEPAGVEFMLDVPAGGTITDIDVTLDITHSWTSDLDVFLIAPDGTSIELFSSVGGGGENFTDTVLDDQAPTAITVGSAPFTGSFRPEGSLATFNGKEAMGTWKLHVIDREPGDTGVVNRWSLTINTGGEAEPSAVTDVDGTYTITLEDTSAGTYTVRDILPAYRTHSTPTGGAATVPVADGQTVTVNFGSYRPGFEGAGVLDTTFDTDGILTFPTLQFQHGGEALAVQADGGVIYGGWIVTETAGDREFFLARLNPDGTPDQSFNNGQGYVATDFINGDDEVRDIVIQDDGKIVAAGFAGGASGSFAFARYNADGSLDNSFDGDGKLIVDVTPNFGDVVTGLAVQTDGKIVAAGTTTSSSGSTDFATVRLNDNGSLDGTFAANGRAINDFLGGIDVPSDVIVDDDGNVLVVGGAMPRTGGGGYLRWVLLRYTPTGQLDATFDAGEGAVGKATHDFGVNALAKTVIQQGDGKYLVGGLIDDRWTLARFNNDGSIDTSFGNNGRTTVNDLIGNPAADFGMALQRDGKILLGGRHESDGGSTRSFAVARFLSDGSLDVDFGELDGFTITDIGDDSSASDLVLTSDDKILLVGGADSGSVTLVRYNNVVAAGPAFATLVNGVLTLTGTEQSDAFTVTQSGTELTVQLGAESTKFNTAEVLGIAFDGLDGDDTLTLDMAGGNLSLASLTIVAGNGADKVALTNGDGKLMTLGSVPSLNGKTLDLGTADVVITNATVAAVEPLLRTARNDALVRWQGPGIGTSSATGDTGLAAVQQEADVLVKYTYNGDANGDGRINADDYFRIDSAFLEQPANPVYGQGDFNYDDTINADDYFLIDSAFLAQGAPLGAPTPLSASVSSATAAAANVESSFVVTETEQPKKVARRAPATDDGVLSRRTQRRAGAAARRGR